MSMTRDISGEHLTDAELFTLAAPPSGEPEALPRHLSQCQLCSRALLDWKAAVSDLAGAQVREIERRSPEEWREKEAATMAAIRRAGSSERRGHPVRWAIGIAASLLIVALAMPRRGAQETAAAPAAPDGMALLSPADQDDDALLRDAEYLAQGGDDSDDLAMEESL
jgi:hypothetical protein